MKFILNGRSFDTATAAPIAVKRGMIVPDINTGLRSGYEGQWDEVEYERTLYRTAKGALFIHDQATLKYPDAERVENEAWEVTPEKAVKWIENENAEILDPTGLDMPEEA